MHMYWTGIIYCIDICVVVLLRWRIICEKLYFNTGRLGAMPDDRWVRPTQLALRPHGALFVAYRTLTYAGLFTYSSLTTMSTISIGNPDSVGMLELPY